MSDLSFVIGRWFVENARFVGMSSVENDVNDVGCDLSIRTDFHFESDCPCRIGWQIGSNMMEVRSYGVVDA